MRASVKSASCHETPARDGEKERERGHEREREKKNKCSRAPQHLMRVSISSHLPLCASSRGRPGVGKSRQLHFFTFSPQTHHQQPMTESFHRFQVKGEFFFPPARSKGRGGGGGGVHSSVSTPHRPQSNIW